MVDGTHGQTHGPLMEAALAVVRQGVAAHKPEEVGVSFNGGKDSVAMLQLIFDALGDDVARRLSFFVFESPTEFPELREFREAEIRRRGATLHKCARDMQAGLWELHKERGLQVAFLGVRDTDPSGGWIKDPVTRCTQGWPDMTLVCPILTWPYRAIWDYTLARGLPVCQLYHAGYTSLGSTATTVPNPALRRADGTYAPAWCLENAALERSNRVPLKSHH